MNPASHRPLFGRVMALANDHEILERALLALEQACLLDDVGGEGEAPPSELIAIVVHWRSELSKHFAAEESDAYFGVIRSDCPSLAPAIDRFERHHGRLLSLSDELIVLVEARRWPELARAAAQLAATFRVHEQQEGLLMQQFLRQPDP